MLAPSQGRPWGCPMDRRGWLGAVVAGGTTFALAIGSPVVLGGPQHDAANAASSAAGTPTDPAIEADYQAFMKWMEQNHPDVKLGDDAMVSPYHVEYVKTLPGTIVKTDAGWVESTSGQWEAPVDAVAYIGDGFRPNGRWVADCREKHVPGRVDPGNCGLLLAMADGNFRPTGGYRWQGGTAYTDDEMSQAVGAAGYRWDRSR